MCSEGQTGTLVAGGNRYKLSERPALPTKLTRAGGDCRGDELSVPDVCGSSSCGLQWRFLHWVGVAILILLLCPPAHPQICLEQQEEFSTPLEGENQSPSDGSPRKCQQCTRCCPKPGITQGGVLRPGRGLGRNLAPENPLIHNTK